MGGSADGPGGDLRDLCGLHRGENPEAGERGQGGKLSREKEKWQSAVLLLALFANMPSWVLPAAVTAETVPQKKANLKILRNLAETMQRRKPNTWDPGQQRAFEAAVVAVPVVFSLIAPPPPHGLRPALSSCSGPEMSTVSTSTAADNIILQENAY